MASPQFRTAENQLLGTWDQVKERSALALLTDRMLITSPVIHSGRTDGGTL